MKATRGEMAGLLALVVGIGIVSAWWSGRQADAIGAEVAALARPGDIRMIASQTCGICASARSWFEAHRIAYSECLIERDPACKAAFDASGSPGTPVMQVRGQTQVGFSPRNLRGALGAKG